MQCSFVAWWVRADSRRHSRLEGFLISFWGPLSLLRELILSCSDCMFVNLQVCFMRKFVG